MPSVEAVETPSCRRVAVVAFVHRLPSLPWSARGRVTAARTGCGAAVATTPTTATGSLKASSTYENARRTIRDIRADWQGC